MARRWTTSSSSGRRGSERPRSRGSSQRRWGSGFGSLPGPALVRTGDLAALLTDLQPGDVLFIDEVHRLPRAVEEVLYPAMEDFQLDLLVGKGPTARSIRLDLPRFTLIGATTRTGLLTSPLRDRFGFVARLDLYGADDLQAIVETVGGNTRSADRPARSQADRRTLEGYPQDRQPAAPAGPGLRGGPGRGLR